MELWVEIVILVAAAIVCFTGGALTIILYLNRKHARLMRHQGLHVTQPQYAEHPQIPYEWSNVHNATLDNGAPRNAHLPYGMAVDGWRNLSGGTMASHQDHVPMLQPQISVTSDDQPPPRRKLSVRKSFSAHSFSVPKTRRQRKLAKTIPLSQVARSPLSAITERSGTNTTTASPAIDLSELPTEATPPRQGIEGSATISRPTSTAWPLKTDKSLPEEMLYAQNGGPLMPFPGSDSNPHSTNLSIPASEAPNEPLPPLPTFLGNNNRWPRRRDSRSCYSNASSDTVATSVLAGSNDPRRNPSSPTNDSWPSVNVHQTGLQKYDSEKAPLGPSTLSLGSPAGKTTMHSTKKVHRAPGSTHGSIVTNSLLQAAISRPSNNGIIIQSDAVARQRSNSDANSSKPGQLQRDFDRSTVGKTNSFLSPDQRHSMFETPSLQSVSPISSPGGSPTSSKRKRPHSVGATPLLSQGLGRTSSSRSSTSSIGSSSGSQRKGHKRQNCVRISNLPLADPATKSSKFGLPFMAEEEEQNERRKSISRESSAERLLQIPGLDLVNPKPDRSEPKFGAHLTPFDNRPILEPTLAQRPPISQTYNTVAGGELDVFDDGSRFGALAKDNIFTRSENHQHELSTQTNEPKANVDSLRATHSKRRLSSLQTANTRGDAPSTPRSAVRALRSELFDESSPILPTPQISSANLFSRRLQSRRFKTSAGGPNGPRAQALGRDSSDSPPSSRPASPTPAPTAAKSKAIRISTESSRQDLRKSAMMLRQRNSDMRDQRPLGNSYRNYRDISDSDPVLPSPSIADYSDNPTPTKSGFSEDVKNGPLSSLANIRMQMKSPSTADMTSFFTREDSRRTFLRPEDASSALNPSRSRYTLRNMGVSPSVISISGQSDMWEDDSVKSDDDDNLPLPGQSVSTQTKQAPIDSGFESFAGACEVVEPLNPKKSAASKTPTKNPKTPTRIYREKPTAPAVLDPGFESFTGANEVVDPRPTTINTNIATKTPIKTPTKQQPGAHKPRDKENIILESGFESFAGACEVVDVPAPSQQQQPLRPTVVPITTTTTNVKTPVKTPKNKKRQGGVMISPETNNNGSSNTAANNVPASTGKTPQYGLGLMNLGPAAFGTPASLYDSEGFLRE